MIIAVNFYKNNAMQCSEKKAHPQNKCGPNVNLVNKSVKTEEKVVEVFARNQVWGTPEQCIEKLRTIRATTDAAEFVGVFTYGDLPGELAERSMRLFAEEVLPALHADEAVPA